MKNTEIKPKDARQGETSGRMRIVLIASTAGAAVVLAALFVFAG